MNMINTNYKKEKIKKNWLSSSFIFEYVEAGNSFRGYFVIKFYFWSFVVELLIKRPFKNKRLSNFTLKSQLELNDP